MVAFARHAEDEGWDGYFLWDAFPVDHQSRHDLCRAENIALAAYAPLAGGFLATPDVTVIPIVGDRTEDHISTALDAVDLELTEAQWRRIATAGDLRLGSPAYLHS